MSRMNYSVPELHCGACEASVRKSLERLAGVDEVTVDLEGRQVLVSFDPAQTDEAAVRAQIEKAGFDVVA